MLWIFQAILQLIFSIIAYITNPIIVLFGNREGKLPTIFKWWETPDNPLDVEWYVKTTAPSWARYDFDKHYVSHEGDTSLVMVPRWVTCIDSHFTIKERIQRYVCRVGWLSRNTAYGFAYYVNGRDFVGANQIVLRADSGGDWLSYLRGGNILIGTWSLYIDKQWCKWFWIRIYAGWKLKGKYQGFKDRSMIALCFWPFRR